MFVRANADFFAGLLFVSHIEVGAGIVADQHDAESGDDSPPAFERVDFFFDFLLHLFGNGSAVNDRHITLAIERTVYKNKNECKVFLIFRLTDRQKEVNGATEASLLAAAKKLVAQDELRSGARETKT